MEASFSKTGVLFLLALAGCSRERPEAFHADHAAVVKSGAMEQGRIPAWIPKGVRNVREWHATDANEGMMTFEVFGEPNWLPPPECHLIPYGDIIPPTVSRLWWPSVTDQESGYDFYECPDDREPLDQRLWVGRAHSGKAGLFWSTPQ